ncbi:tetratricopeptide repeat protein [bacterium]|nr:tetratricopeptide repeat protein [bacterium]
MKWKLASILIFCLLWAGCATSRYQAAEEALDQKEYDQAIRNYLKMLQPRIRDGKRFIMYDREAVTGIGVAYWHKQSYNSAAKIFKTVLEKDPAHGKAAFFLAMCQEALGQEDLAIATYKSYPSLNENDPYRYFMFGRLDWIKQVHVRRELQKAMESEDIRRFDEFPESSVAVTYFLNLSDDPEWAPLQKGLADLLVRDLSCISNLTVVDRSLLNSLMTELGLDPMSVREPEVQQRVARLLGVRYLIRGSYLITDNLKMTLDAEIVAADNNTIASTMNFDGNIARFFKIEKELALRISDFFGIFITDQERNELLEIPTEDIAAFLSYCQGLDAMDQSSFRLAQNYFHRAIKYDGDFVAARDYMVNPDIWEVTHNYNQMRVSYEVRHMVETTAKGRARLVFMPPPDLVSPYNRLQWLGVQQNNQILPGQNSRNPFVEASFSSAPIIPYMLSEPPSPPEQ